MERRELLATDLAAIAGVAFVDNNADGIMNGTDQPIANEVNLITLFRDDPAGASPGVFDGADPTAGTGSTDATGNYLFPRLIEGRYFLRQNTVPGLTAPPIATIDITAAQADGVQTAVIDEYQTTVAPLTASPGTTNQFLSAAAAEAAGGNRDIDVNLGVNSSSGTLVGNVTYQVDPNLQTISVGGTDNASVLVQYDGPENTLALDNTGLGGLSVGGGAPGQTVDMNGGFIVMLRAQSAGDFLTITVHSGANSSTVTQAIPDNVALQELFIPFSAFTGNVDFNDVGAIEAFIPITVTDNDVAISIVEARQQEVTTADLPNIQQLSLGGQIFIDNSTAGQNDGLRQGTEPGVVGVSVDLYQLANPSDVVDPATDAVLRSETTIAGGIYTFANLDPGHYAVVIPGGQAVLFGYGNSTGNGTPTDPDDNIDNDDEGIVLASGAVRSGTITLESNSEPTTDGDPPSQPDNDANTNTTLDFGFFPQVDLSVTKTVNPAASDLANDLVVFDIVVQNLQPAGVDILTATGVTFTDSLPTGLLNPQVSGGGITAGDVTIVGQDVTVDLGSLPVDGSVSFQLTADIAAGRTDDITNTAEVFTLDQVDIDPANDMDDELVDVLSADLVITKTGDPATANAGGLLTYTITVDNNGPNDATGVVVTDNLPAGVTFNAAASSGAISETPAGSGQLQIFLGTILSGAAASATIVVDVADNAVSPLTNDASVVADSPNDPDLTNNDTSTNNGTVTTPVERLVDVTIEKSVPTPADVIAGGTFTYEVTVTNLGPSEARDVEVTDVLDSALTFVSFDPGLSSVTRDPTDDVNLLFDVGTLPAGAANAVTFSFDVSLAASATGTIDNTSVVSTTDNEPTVDNVTNTSTVSSPINRDVDLTIVKAVNLTTAVPGASLDQPPVDPDPRLIYTFDVTNNGISDAFNVIATDDLSETLPIDRLTNVVAASADGTASFDNLTDIATVDFGTIPAGETRQFTITADITATATGTIANDAVVDADDTVPVTSNTVTTDLTPNFDLTITKTRSSAATVGPNDNVSFDLVVSHDTAGSEVSPSTATGVVITDVLPAGLTFVSATFDGSPITLTPNAGGEIVFPAFDLDPGDTRTATIVASADASASGLLTNDVSITTDPGETDTTNNSSSDSVTVEPEVDLSITKSVNPTMAQVGNQLTYTMLVTNNGPSTAVNVIATDTLPAGVSFVSGTDAAGQPFTSTGSGVTVNGQQITVNGGNLDADDSFSFTITATIGSGAASTITNNVSVDSDTNEVAGALANNSASASTTVDPLTSSISGVVYVDANNNGVHDTGELPIPDVILTLTGTDTLGNPVNRTEATGTDGNYLFGGLAAGTYTVTETQPSGFRDGQETLGSGATALAADDVFTQLGLGADTDAVQFNFGELNQPLSKRRFLASS